MATTEYERFIDSPNYTRGKELGKLLTADEINALHLGVRLLEAALPIFAADHDAPTLERLGHMLTAAIGRAYNRELSPDHDVADCLYPAGCTGCTTEAGA